MNLRSLGAAGLWPAEPTNSKLKSCGLTELSIAVHGVAVHFIQAKQHLQLQVQALPLRPRQASTPNPFFAAARCVAQHRKPQQGRDNFTTAVEKMMVGNCWLYAFIAG